MPIASPRYAFNAVMVSGAPPDPGVVALWHREITSDPREREAELLREFERKHARLPRCNARAA